MITRNIITAAAMAAVLAACGGGGGPSAADDPQFAPPLAAAAAAHGQAPAAEIFGDSTLVRIYADQSRDAVQYAADALGLQLINSAVAGSSAVNATAGRIASSPAPVVALNWAINDPYTTTATAYRDRLTAQAQAAELAGKVVLLIESTPIVPGGSLSSKRSEASRQQYEAIKRDVAGRTGSFYCAMPARAWSLADKPDGIHESEAAAAWKGGVLADCIRRAAQ